MKIVFATVVLLLCALIVCYRGERRSNIFLLATFFIPNLFGTAHILFPIAYLVSMQMKGELKDEFKTFPFRNISVAILVIYVLICMFNDPISIANTVVKPVRYFISTYLNLFVGYCLLKQRYSWVSLSKTLLIIFSLYAIYGICTFVMQGNPYYDFVVSVYGEGGSVGMWSEVQDRGYRVNSFLSNPIAYGLVMALAAMSLWVYYLRSKSRMVLALLCLIAFNVVLSNSRSSFSAFAIGVIIYAVLYYGVSRKMLVAILCACVVVNILYYNVENVASMIDSVVDIWQTGGDSMEGSNMELKKEQLAVSLLYFQESPIWGHGIGYFRDVIQERYGTQSGLAGLEGYEYRMLVELGLVMIVAFVVFVIRFIIVVARQRKHVPLLSCIILGQFAAFMFFLMATGDYGNVFEYAFILIGINLKVLLISSNARHPFPRNIRNTLIAS